MIGYYEDAITAAIAYNKAADLLGRQTGRHYRQNYIEDLSPKEYASRYLDLQIPDKITDQPKK